MKKVWLVERSRGFYEDYISWNDSVWESFEDAEKRALELALYDPQKELENLEDVAEDPYGNKLTVADILYDGIGDGGMWDNGALINKVSKVNNENGVLEFVFPTIPGETYTPLKEHPHYAVNDRFLKEYNITVEDADKYITWLEDTTRDEWSPTIIEMEVGVAQAERKRCDFNDDGKYVSLR